MARLGLIVHRDRPAAAELTRSLIAWLAGSGHEVVMPPTEAFEVDCGHLRADPAEFAALDLVVTLGGDGSILRAVELIGEAGVAILGVDFGQLGYLTEVQPEQARAAIERVLAGDYEVEPRMLLAVEVSSGSGTSRHIVLNEAVVERAAEANTIRLGVHINDEFFTTYAADGLIVATPTGSTAYAFSARGPIIDPTQRALVLTPVSPHMLFDRSLVMSAETRLRLVVDGHRAATLSLDGRRLASLNDSDTVTCSAASRSARLVTFGPRRFQRVLKTKFGLDDR